MSCKSKLSRYHLATCVFPEIKDGKVVGDPDPIKRPIDDLKLKENAAELFDCIAEVVAEFIEKEKITKRLPLGFTFSYPVKNLSLNSGVLLRWTKGFKAVDAVGKNPVELLNEAFKRKGVSIQVPSVVVGHLLVSKAYVHAMK